MSWIVYPTNPYVEVLIPIISKMQIYLEMQN